MNAVDMRSVSRATEPEALATERPRGRTPAWWGMVLLITTEVVLFAVLLASYFFVQFTTEGPWPPGGIRTPELRLPLIMTVLLLSSSAPMAWADRAIRRGYQGQLAAGLALALLLGAAFLTLQGIEYDTKLAEFTWTSYAYGSLFYAITGFHGFHVAAGLFMIGFTLVGTLRGRYTYERHERVRQVAFYWHAIDGLWILILSSLYLSPHV
ncbi:cytochrome c oxidase subunit 3 [Phytoactinopolyspora halotolerans]|uniref:cytochrome-c oxidase n=1 Tax=Phytoactinopolyspora halotolerans TaxID=1981512 RepID=A0A6L9SAF9_9ACTN|nr:heme-copper oxidase subunit III [Phytoactinopolyspora halotolerans]NEE02023.1 heme-copper oxidase subunit III [Phytoactinopolyspora halotolerans]